MKRQPLWKKLTALAAALALTAALAGCGSAGGGSDAAPGETAATESFSMDNAALATADGGGCRHADAAGDRRERAQDHLQRRSLAGIDRLLTRPARP